MTYSNLFKRNLKGKSTNMTHKLVAKKLDNFCDILIVSMLSGEPGVDGALTMLRK